MGVFRSCPTCANTPLQASAVMCRKPSLAAYSSKDTAGPRMQYPTCSADVSGTRADTVQNHDMSDIPACGLDRSAPCPPLRAPQDKQPQQAMHSIRLGRTLCKVTFRVRHSFFRDRIVGLPSAVFFLSSALPLDLQKSQSAVRTTHSYNFETPFGNKKAREFYFGRDELMTRQQIRKATQEGWPRRLTSRGT